MLCNKSKRVKTIKKRTSFSMLKMKTTKMKITMRKCTKRKVRRRRRSTGVKKRIGFLETNQGLTKRNSVT